MKTQHCIFFQLAKASQEELRLLELLRHGLDIERLAAAAIERAARARYSPI